MQKRDEWTDGRTDARTGDKKLYSSVAIYPPPFDWATVLNNHQTGVLGGNLNA